MKAKEVEQLLNTILKEVQELKERVNTLERGVFVNVKIPGPWNKQEITKVGKEIIEKEEK